jgi:hypothetical protein
MEKDTVTLQKGTIVKVKGIPYELTEDAKITTEI